jgi:hypothetical protein
LTQDDR